MRILILLSFTVQFVFFGGVPGLSRSGNAVPFGDMPFVAMAHAAAEEKNSSFLDRLTLERAGFFEGPSGDSHRVCRQPPAL